jgi:ElaB/YqjD/DUF883 family membrane-anchored ribosome-binding protein
MKMETIMAARRKATTPNLEARLEALRADLLQLQTDLKGLAGGVGDEASSRLSEMLSATEDMADQVATRVEEWTDDNMDSLRESVRDQPVAAVLMSLGVGALLGAIFLRR